MAFPSTVNLELSSSGGFRDPRPGQLPPHPCPHRPSPSSNLPLPSQTLTPAPCTHTPPRVLALSCFAGQTPGREPLRGQWEPPGLSSEPALHIPVEEGGGGGRGPWPAGDLPPPGRGTAEAPAAVWACVACPHGGHTLGVWGILGRGGWRGHPRPEEGLVPNPLQPPQHHRQGA